MDQYIKETSGVTARLSRILELAISVDGASFGNIQVYNPKLEALELAVCRGFPISFVQFFQFVRADEPCACGRAIRHRERIVIPDVTVDPYFVPYLSLAQDAGFRSVQSTPIFGPDDDILGVISTHFSDVHHLSPSANAVLDECAARAASILATERI